MSVPKGVVVVVVYSTLVVVVHGLFLCQRVHRMMLYSALVLKTCFSPAFLKSHEKINYVFTFSGSLMKYLPELVDFLKTYSLIINI